MKRSLLTLLSLVWLATLAVGCGGNKSSGPVKVNGYKEYADAVVKFAVRYPDNWTNSVNPGHKAVFYSSGRMFDAFIKGIAEPGAKIEVAAMPGDAAAVQASIDSLKANFTDPNVVKAPEKSTLNGMEATKVSYGYDFEDTKLTAERYYVVKDGMVSYLETAVIGNYADYATVFDTARASFRPGTPAVAATPAPTPGDTSHVAARDSDVVDAPAADFKSYSGPGFSIQYPSNFSPTTGAAGKGAIAAVTFSGTRNDSYYRVDVFTLPSGMTLDQVAEQNKKVYKGAASPATVGGQKGVVFNYNAGGGKVTSHAYFVVANNKLYRITTNWFTPQQQLYQPAFQKALGTFAAK
jgi:hypothetical protein